MAEPKPETFNGRVLAFLRQHGGQASLTEIMEATGIQRHRAITALSELCLNRLIERNSNGLGTLFSAFPDYPPLPAIGARPGLELRPYLGFTIPRQEVHHAPQ